MAAHSLSSTLPSTRIHKPGSQIPNPFHLSLTQNFKAPRLQNPRLGVSDLFHQSSNPILSFRKQRRIAASVLFSLPTANPERVSSTEKDSKWSEKAIKAFSIAETEARKANGFTLTKVREESLKLHPKGDRFFTPPAHPPLTEAAQKSLDWAVDEMLKSCEDGEVTTSHLLLGIWSQKESKGHKILAALGFTDEKAKEIQSVISKPGFSDY